MNHHTFTRVKPVSQYLWSVEAFIEWKGDQPLPPNTPRALWVKLHDCEGIPWADVRRYLPHNIHHQRNHFTSDAFQLIKESLSPAPRPPLGEGFVIHLVNGYQPALSSGEWQGTVVKWAFQDGHRPRWAPIGITLCVWCTQPGHCEKDATVAFLGWRESEYQLEFLCDTCAHDITPGGAQ